MAPQPLLAAPENTPEVVVTGQLRPQSLAGVPAGVTVLDGARIHEVAVQHFEELVLQVPNLQWSGEGSRARYLQIRGTGELAQYEGAPNPSVGFLVDDIDLSGIGAVATLFDVDRVEVLKGPQGTRYGANALAGLVYVASAAPTPEPTLSVTATGGSDDTLSLGAVAGSAVPGTDGEAAWRLSVQQYRSDGFRHNAFLGRDDTNDRDELTARLRLRWEPNEAIRTDLVLLHVDLDNGYDAFALDNGFTTWSDKPGHDAQQTDAVSLRATAALSPAIELVSITSAATSDMLFSFDSDWGNDAYWSERLGAPAVYDFVDATERDRDTLSQEFRLASLPAGRLFGADWLVGAYVLDLSEDNRRTSGGECSGAACPDPLVIPAGTVASSYDATNLAFFGELDIPLGASTRLVPGLRWEQRRADYVDPVNDQSPSDRMLGGSLSLTHDWRAGLTSWARIARGYKAGGFNPSLGGNPELADQVSYDPEYLWSLEAGSRIASADRRWDADLTIFWQRRDDLQIEIPRQLLPSDPNTFLFYTENAEEGRTWGAETTVTWRPAGGLELHAAVALLQTEITSFPEKPQLEGRDLAHAPHYGFTLGAAWRSPGGWFARADFGGKGRYYIDYCQEDSCNDPQLPAYQVLDLRLGREWDRWAVTAWVRNALDEEYALRGFYFGNEPPDFPKETYVRLGDPRHAGVTVNWSW